MLYAVAVAVELILRLWLNMGRQSTHITINALPRRSLEAPIAGVSLTPWGIIRAQLHITLH